MNYTKVLPENMCYLEADKFEYHDLVERLVLDELSVFYVKKSDKIIGVLDKADVISRSAPSMQKEYIEIIWHLDMLIFSVFSLLNI